MPAGEPPQLERLIRDAVEIDLHPLLPRLHQREGATVQGTTSLAAAAELSGGRWLGVFRGEGGRLAAPFVLDGDTPTRAQPGDGAATSLVERLIGGGSARENDFAFTSFTHDGWHPGDQEVGERPMLVDQTHESVVVGERAVVKWAVRAEPTPAPVLVAHLQAAGFLEMPRPWGFVTWPDGHDELLVASVVQYLPGASDGWTWAAADAADYAAHGAGIERSVAHVAAVGPVVADLHLAMSRPTHVLEAPELMADHGEVVRWRDLALNLVDEAVSAVDGPEGARLSQLRPALGDAIEQLGRIDEATTIPVHGDLHVGQVMRWDEGFAIGDFDGNPVLPIAERLSTQPAARDVAGMVQSIDHVGRVVIRRVEGADPARVHEWIAVAQKRFLDGYRARLAERGQQHLLDDRLMLPFQAEQECREFLYAVRHLPRWRYVPDQALQALFGQL